MSKWNAGMLGVMAKLNLFIVKNSFELIIPLLHHSIIPIWSEAPKFVPEPKFMFRSN